MCVCHCVCVRVCTCSAFFFFLIILYVNCFGRTMLYMCIEYHILVNMYHVRAQGVDERMINVHYYYYYYQVIRSPHKECVIVLSLYTCAFTSSIELKNSREKSRT